MRNSSGDFSSKHCSISEFNGALTPKFVNLGHVHLVCFGVPQVFKENEQPFDVALAVTRAGNLFTTHTAVAAGFDRFPPALIEQYLGRYAMQKLGITLHELLGLGRQNPNDPTESFKNVTAKGSRKTVSTSNSRKSRPKR